MIWSEEMIEAMMSIISYCDLEKAFKDAIATCEPDQYTTYMALAGLCVLRWYTEGILTDPIIEETSWYAVE